MEKVDHLKDALAARRGKGMEIIIGVGGHGGGEKIPPFEHGGKVEGTDLGEHEAMDARGKGSPYGHTGKVDGTGGSGEGAHADDSKRSDLAPPRESHEAELADEASGNGMHTPLQDRVMGGQHEMAPGDVPTNDDTKAHLMGNLTEVDLRDMANRKPRSLVERARQDAFRKKA